MAKQGGGKMMSVMIVLLVSAIISYGALINRFNIQQIDYFGGGGGLSPQEIRRLRTKITYLETKIDSYLAYKRDPFLSMKTPATCNTKMTIKEIACPGNEKCEVDNSVICMDRLPYVVGDDANKKKHCTIYDFGVRESPDFGLAFAKQCNVVGFDPSPISVKWWEKNRDEIRKQYPNYQFSAMGAGGTDGEVTLREYDWGQVSIIEFPKRVVNTNDCDSRGNCKYTFYNQQGSHQLPVRTLDTIMKSRGHFRINLLKLDVEGSEYAFLETMIDDLSCRKVDQLVLEWHHYDHDVRYGVTSTPQINVLVALLKQRCGLEQFWVHGSHGWPSNQKQYAEMGMNLYYTLSSFRRTQWKF